MNTVFDRYGQTSSPLLSEVQNEEQVATFQARGLSLQDAQYTSQAISNRMDVFLTRDMDIIKSHRDWLEAEFPTLKIRLPTELLDELLKAGLCS